ncbi:MAG: 3-phosphoserine/phosphohydroxythreonine transaminase [Anaerovoracaceae bacterium]
MNRVFNFSAGPSMLPEKVINKMAGELLNYENSGQSVMEMSHRSKEFMKIAEDAEANLRALMSIPSNYKVLFLQGGATLQFSMIPLNLLKTGKADYIITGAWSKKASEEAEKYAEINISGTSEARKFANIPKERDLELHADVDYVHITLNNTIYGTHFPYIPETGDIPLVADMSSCILSEEIDVSKFGVIYAGAQKNIGPAGVTIVIIREDLIGNAADTVPTYLNYKTHVDNSSMYNTPPCFAIYAAGEIFKMLLENGGIKEVEKINKEKAERLYSYIDNSSIYFCPVINPDDRSLMNVVFITGDKDLDKKFIEEAKEGGLVNLGGHRSIGGMRASIYNGMPREGVRALIEFMAEFEERNK